MFFIDAAHQNVRNIIDMEIGVHMYQSLPIKKDKKINIKNIKHK